MIREHDEIRMRVIDDKKPDVSAVNVQGNLEDVFLYYFGEADQW